tara:strand:- start:7633 stop:8097 length:465 start_codon:yes stop_codon:yes gene_type:complete
MPMIVLNTDGLETSASSHDVMAGAIGNMFLLQSIPEVAASKLTPGNDQKKLQVLLGLYEANKTLFQRWPREEIPQQAYTMFQHAFREFMNCYPGHSDLRFAPLDTVDKHSTIHKQAIKHLQAQATLTGETLLISDDVSYAHILETYCRNMQDEL